MSSMTVSKSQKRLLVVLAIVAAYAMYDLTTPSSKSHKIESRPTEHPGSEVVGTTAGGSTESTQTIQETAIPAMWRRDPFRRFSDISAATMVGQALQTILLPKLAGLHVTAISRDGEEAYALINDDILSVGESIQGYRVVEIRAAEVVLKKNDATFTLTLPEEEFYE